VLVNHLEQDIIAIVQDQKPKPDIGVVGNGKINDYHIYTTNYTR
jgi:hypothetical protein